MRSKVINDGSQRTYAMIFDKDDEVVSTIEHFAEQNNLVASQVTGLGAFKDVVLGYFDWERKDYRRIPLSEQVELVSLIGIVVLTDGRPKLHAHVVVGRADGTTRGGHLLAAHVRPTLEVIVTESPEFLRREIDAETGLPLIRIGN